MDFLLTSAGLKKELATAGKNGDDDEPLFQIISSSVIRKTPPSVPAKGVSSATEVDTKEEKPRRGFTGASVEEALEVLKNEPDYDSLIQVLRYLSAEDKEGGVLIARPSPTAAQVVKVVVAEIVPNYWVMLREDSSRSCGMPSSEKGRGQKGDEAEDVELLLDSLRSLTGVNAVLLHLAALTKEAQRGRKERERREDVAMSIHTLLEVMERVLEGDERVVYLWRRSTGRHTDTEGESAKEREKDKMRRRALWTQFMGLFAGEKIVGICAEAEEIASKYVKEGKERVYWVARGKQFSAWKGRNLVSWSRTLGAGGAEEDQKRVAELFTKSGKGVHGDSLVRQVLEEMVFSKDTYLEPFKSILGQVPSYEQQKMISMVLRLLSEEHLNALGNDLVKEDPLVSASAGLLRNIIGKDKSRTQHLVSWITSSSGAGLGEGIAIRRAVVALLAEERETLISALEKSMEMFGDMIYVKHAPILQQEVHAQALLLLAGYANRLSHMKLTMLLRGTTFLNSVSNRLTAPQIRARFLGMVVGEALSTLVDTGNKRLDFHMGETNTDEGMWYKSLVNVQDSVGDPAPLFSSPGVQVTEAPPLAKKPRAEVKSKGKAKANTEPELKPATIASMPKPGFIIEELDDDDDEDDADLAPYAKPPSDASDSEDDPTLIRRDRPRPPVYIRDLITYFRATEDHDRQVLAMRTAPDLIRRKGKFGTEVSAHAETLAGLLVGAENKFDDDDDDDDYENASEEGEKNFEELRNNALVALTTSVPEKMGPWLGKMLWAGDYSTAQRRTILVALGLAGRELAGLEGHSRKDDQIFVGKRLPERLERMFLEEMGEEAGATGNGDNTTGSRGGRGNGRRQDLKPLPPTALESITHTLTQRFLAPMAAEAADMAAGPDVLKLETYKERLLDSTQQEAEPSSSTPGAFLGKGKIIRQTTRRAQRVKAIPNTSASIISASLFSPLSSRLLPSLRSSSGRGSSFLPLLPLAVRTLGVLLHAAGPNTSSLPQMTAEFWDVLLALRQKCDGDIALTAAVVEGFVVLLEVNGVSSSASAAVGGGVTSAMAEGKVRDLCVNFGKEMMETMEWVGVVFGNLRGDDAPVKGLGAAVGGQGGRTGMGGDRSEEARVKAMAAGVLVKLQEVSEKFRGLMLGLGG